jgi:hypothetical protein
VTAQASDSAFCDCTIPTCRRFAVQVLQSQSFTLRGVRLAEGVGGATVQLVFRWERGPGGGGVRARVGARGGRDLRACLMVCAWPRCWEEQQRS